MKTRIRRFWISVSLAAGSLALPLSGKLSAHDLPTRWTSGANSTPSWNYLLDDCLDMPTLPGTASLTDVQPDGRRGTEDWASNCPTEWAAGINPAGPAANVEIDGLFRNPLSRFSKEMTCWVNEWQMIQMSAGRAAQPKLIWAARPDAGQPPAPDYSVHHYAAYEQVPLADTCAFDAEYQARQTAADLLAKEIARAAEISKSEARLSQSIVDAERIQAIVELDAIPSAVRSDAMVQSDSDAGRMLCGGEAREIMTAQCFPNRFAPGIVDEYVAYDMDSRDHHWLGGLGKSWKLRSALGGAPMQFAQSVASDANEAEDAWAVPVDEANRASDSAMAPESFIAPDRVGHDQAIESLVGADLARDSAANDAEINAYLEGIVERAQLSALSLLQSARESSRPMLPQAEVLPELLPNLGRALAAASEWVEEQQCSLAGEMCGFDSAYNVGAWMGEQSLAASDWTVDNMIALGFYLDLPTAQPSLEVYVIYVDAEGNSLAVPSSLARAWNRPEAEAASTLASESIEEQAVAVTETNAIDSDTDRHNAATDWVVVDQIGAQLLSTLAKRLDAIGMGLLHASDALSTWADTQIASRESSVR